MAEKKQTTTKRTYNKKTTEKKEEIKVEIPIVKEEAKEKVAPTIKGRKKLDLTSMVACRNACKSRLVYVSKRQMGYEIVWENFGSIEWVELGELVSLKNTYPRFFKDGWLIIEDPEVIEYLDLEKYYQNLIDIDNFDDIFYKDPKELEEVLTKLPSGVKDTVIEKAREKIADGTLDSIKRIEVIEKVYNVDLRL